MGRRKGGTGATQGGPEHMKRRGKRRAVDHGHLEIRWVTIENPDFADQHDERLGNPRYITAPVNMRESPVTWMLAHGKLDAAQAEAGARFRRLHELSGGADLSGMDTTKEPVDGGGFPDVLTDRKSRAAKELAQARVVLGFAGYDLVMQVCGQCLWIKDIEPTKHRQIVAANRLRLCLTALAEFWGLQSRPYRSWHKAG